MCVQVVYLDWAKSQKKKITDKYIKDLEYRAATEKGYAFNLRSGNHFLILAQDTQTNDMYIVIHSSANGHKDSSIGLYPSENNWYKDEIRFHEDKQTGRYMRWIKGETASRFIDKAHQLEKYNALIHHWLAEELAKTLKSFIDVDGTETKHHYYMPTESSIAIGTYVERPKTIVPIFSNRDKNIVLFKISSDNYKITIRGEDHCIVPHGWGQECALDSISVQCEDNKPKTLRINGHEIPITPDARIKDDEIGKKVRDFESFTAFQKKGAKVLHGEIVCELKPIYAYHKKDS